MTENFKADCFSLMKTHTRGCAENSSSNWPTIFCAQNDKWSITIWCNPFDCTFSPPGTNFSKYVFASNETNLLAEYNIFLKIIYTNCRRSTFYMQEETRSCKWRQIRIPEVPKQKCDLLRLEQSVEVGWTLNCSMQMIRCMLRESRVSQH